MKITEVKISLRNDRKLKGFANIALDGQFVIRGLKIIEGIKGFFIAMPSRPQKDGSYRDVAHPINNDFRIVLERKILEKYWEEVGRTGSGSSAFGESEFD